MVKNDSFSFFSSPSTANRTLNDTFNDSFAERNKFSVFRAIQIEHDKICSVIKSGQPSPSQYQNSLNELISLFERCDEESTTNNQRLVLSVFLKLCANILSVLNKKTFQPTLYWLAQIISHSITPTEEDGDDQQTLKKWADRITYECYTHVPAPKANIDLNFNNDQVVDDLSLSNGRFQFVRTSIFEFAKDLARELNTKDPIDSKSFFKSEYLSEEYFLQLLLWNYKKRGVFMNESFLEAQFPKFPVTPDAEKILKSKPSLLDVKLFLVSLSVLSSNTTENGNTAKEEPSTAVQLTISKIQRECWKAIVNKGQRGPQTAISIRRISNLLDAVRLTDGGSEDVRVLFEAWKKCLQPSTAMDEAVYQAVKQVAEIYRTKMNSLLANGVFYSGGSVSSLIKTTWERRQEVPTLFPLQFDYQFVNTDEAGHIGTIINSTEGYVRIEMEDAEDEEEEEAEYEMVDQNELDNDVGESSFRTAPEKNESYQHDSADEFYSPLKHNRDSMMPESIGKLIREESQANTSMVSTKSVIMTPSRDKTPKKTTPSRNLSKSPFVGMKPLTPTTPTTTPQKWTTVQKTVDPFSESGEGYELKSQDESYDGEEDEEYEDEEDILEAALLESSRRHEESDKTPVKPPIKEEMKTPKTEPVIKVEVIEEEEIEIKPPLARRRLQPKPQTPKKDAQTETDVPDLELSPGRQTSISPKSVSLSNLVDSEVEKNQNSLLTPEEEAELIDKLLEASTRMLRDVRLQKTGIPHEKIDTDTMNEDEIWQKIDKKVSRCQADLKTSINRLEAFNIKKEVSPSNPVFSGKSSPKLDHPSDKCLGCQPEYKQEAALRCLETLALKFDAEGQDQNDQKILTPFETLFYLKQSQGGI